MSQKYDIFISYRRKGGLKDARLIDEKLRNRGYSVFFDIDTLGRGKFTDMLNKRLQGCKDFIVIFEPSYFERFYNENGKVQPEEVLNEDWCYLELKSALLMNKNVIPLIHKDFVFPNNLPRNVKDVAEMNAIELSEKEYKEIFEYKIKSYLISKPKFTYRHRTSIIFASLLAVLCIIAYLISFSVESQRKAAERVQRAVFMADSIQKASEARTEFIADSIKKQAQAELDSIKAKEQQPVPIPSSSSGNIPSQKAELYWVANGEETGKIIFGKLSGAGFKAGKCKGNGIKVSPSVSSCVPTQVGTIKCAYAPQLAISNCAGTQKSKLDLGQTFSGLSSDATVAKQKMLEDLRRANLGPWVSKLKALK